MKVKMCCHDQRRVCMRDQKSKRQERFIQQKRFKDRVKKHSYFTWGTKDKVNMGILYHTRARCSCEMCGNPRKHFGYKTIHEISNEEVFKLEIKAYEKD